jgi:hypothetical protein
VVRHGVEQGSPLTRGFVARPVAVALAIACFYVGWSSWYVVHHPVVSLAHVSPVFSQRSHGSTVISHLPASPRAGTGYDGQFFLYIALDPIRARGYLDVPAYRYSRPLYPLAARLLALGRRGAVPWALLVLGIGGVVAATYAVAALFERRRAPVWYAALLGLYPGLLIAVSWDLAEAMAYGLAALGLLAFYRDGRRVLLAGVLFGLAGATRESTLLFPIALALSLAWRPRSRRDALELLVASLVPYVAVKLGLSVWLHSAGTAQATQFETVPFLGLIRQWSWTDRTVQEVLAVVLPALGALLVAWRAYRRVSAEFLALLLNVLALVVFLPKPSYFEYLASGRIATGVVLAFMLCLPRVLAEHRESEAWPLFVLWLMPLYVYLPAVLYR